MNFVGGQGKFPDAPSWRRSLLGEARCWLVVLLPLATVLAAGCRYHERHQCRRRLRIDTRWSKGV